MRGGAVQLTIYFLSRTGVSNKVKDAGFAYFALLWPGVAASHCAHFDNPAFIHPSIFVRLSEVESWRQKIQDILLPSDTLQLLLGDPEAFPGQKGHIIPPASPGSAQGLLPVGLIWKNLQREVTGRLLTRCPNHLSWFFSMRRSRCSTPSSSPYL